MDERIIVRESSAELKELSKMALRGLWFKAIIGAIIYYAMVELAPALISSFIPSINYVYTMPEVHEWELKFSPLLYIYRFFLAGPFLIGYIRFILTIIRRREVDNNLLFSGFNNFLNSFLLQFLIGIFVMLWNIPFLALSAIGGAMSLPLLNVVGSVGIIVITVWAYVRYGVAAYFMADDSSLSPMDCIKLSKTKMEGNKGKYIYIAISFIGWIIVSGMLSGILGVSMLSLPGPIMAILEFLANIPSFFVYLYMQCTIAFFYEILSGHLRKEM